MGFGYDESCGTNSHNDYDHVATDDAAGDKAIIIEALEVIAENALMRMDKFKAQGEQGEKLLVVLLKSFRCTGVLLPLSSSFCDSLSRAEQSRVGICQIGTQEQTGGEVIYRRSK